MSELKPCPLCGGKAVLIRCRSLGLGYKAYAVECERCRLATMHESSEIAVAETWNSRVEDSGHELRCKGGGLSAASKLAK